MAIKGIFIQRLKALYLHNLLDTRRGNGEIMVREPYLVHYRPMSTKNEVCVRNEANCKHKQQYAEARSTVRAAAWALV